MLNLLLDTDSYKIGHHKMFHPGVENMQYHLLSRGGPFDNIVFFGLEHFLVNLMGPAVTPSEIDEAERIINAHLGPGAFPREKWEHIWDEHDGFLPLSIHALPEGTVVNPWQPLLTVEATCPKCAWLPGYIETHLERLWYPVTIATQSRWMRQLIKTYIEATSDGDMAFDFRLHDFGGRSYTSHEAAGIGGAAHLAVGWQGTDTVAALAFIKDTYSTLKPGTDEDVFPAFSVPASEHSVVGTWGQGNERDYLGHLLANYPTGILSVVADTYDYYAFVRDLVCDQYKDDILKRDGVFVVRPDSGHFAEILPWTFNTMWDAFGGTTNSKGYKVLNPKVRVILGDGINRETLELVLECVAQANFSIENLVLGCGSGLIQRGITRDTLKMAYKANWALINGEDTAVYKDPVTDPGKKSLRGYLDPELHGLVPVFYNGNAVNEETPNFNDIRKRCAV